MRAALTAHFRVVRALNPSYRDRFLKALAIKDKSELDSFIHKIHNNEIYTPEWRGGWGRPNIVGLANLNEISNSYIA